MVIRADSGRLVGVNRRSGRKRIDGNLDAIHIGASTIGSRDTIYIISSGRHHINCAVVRAGAPSINNVRINDVAEVSGQSDMLTLTNLGSGSEDMKICTERGDGNAFRSRFTTSGVHCIDRVHTRSSIIRVVNIGTIPNKGGSCIISNCGQRGGGTVANSCVASNSQNHRISHNGNSNRIRNRRHTAVGVNDAGVDTVNTGDMTIKADGSQILTRNFNAVHVPNEGSGGVRGSRNGSLGVLTHGDSSAKLRSLRKFVNENLNAVHIATATIRSRDTIFIISSCRHHINSAVMRTGAPCIDHIGINMVAEVGAQSDVLAFTDCSGRSRNVQIRSKRRDREGHRIRHTAISALSNHTVHTRSCLERGFGSCFAIPIQFGRGWIGSGRKRSRAAIANDGCSGKGHNHRHSVNLKVQSGFFGSASGIGIRGNHFHNMITHAFHIGGIDRVACTSNEDTVEVPSVNRVHSLVRVSHLERGEACTERRGGRAFESKGDIAQRSGVLFKSNGIAFKIITSKIDVNRQSDIFVTSNRVGNFIGISVGSGLKSTILIPFPLIGLDSAGAESLGGQSDRSSTFTELRCIDGSDGSGIYIEIMNRSISHFATVRDNLAVELIHESVRKRRKDVNRKAIRGARGTNNKLAITSPLVLHRNGGVGSLGSESHDIVLTSVLRSHDSTHNIIGHSQHNGVGCNRTGRGSDTTADCVGSDRIVGNRECCTGGIGGSAVHIPLLGNHCLSAFRSVADSKHFLVRRAKAHKLRRGRRNRRHTRIYGFGIRKERMRCWCYPTGQRCFRIFEMRRFTARLACS